MKRLLLMGILFIGGTAYGEEAKKFSNESEVSLLKVGGNSETDTYNAKTTNKYKMSLADLLIFGGHYTFGKSAAEVTARNWDGNLRYERVMGKTYNLFLGEIIEGDSQASLEIRYNTDFGVKYKFIETEKSDLFAEVAYRYSVEQTSRLVNDNPNNKTFDWDQSHKAKLYVEGNKKMTETMSGKVWAEYVPNFSESTDWLLSFGPSMAVAMNANFSLKFGYKHMYDNAPAAGKKKTDTQYSTTLIANF